MTEGPTNEELCREAAYYRRQLEELTAANLQHEAAVARLGHRLRQRESGFALLTHLQQSADLRMPFEALLALAVDGINGSLAMDRTILLAPGEAARAYRGAHAAGFSEAPVPADIRVSLPRDLLGSDGHLLVTSRTDETAPVAALREALQMPFFIAVPAPAGEGGEGLLAAGRLTERRPARARLDEGDLSTLRAIVIFLRAAWQNYELARLREEHARQQAEIEQARALEQTNAALERANRELRDAKARLERQAMRLQELSAAKSRFFANISHEFRTPLTLILGPAEEALARDDLSEKQKQMLRGVKSNASRLLILVDRLLDLAALEDGRAQLHSEPLDLAALVRACTRSFAPLADRRGITLRFRGPGEPLRCVGDREKIEEMTGNLISNALKFTDRHGKVLVSVSAEDEAGEAGAIITVRDTGIGIEPEHLDRIFERFERAKGAAGRPGTGIGLALAREHARLHGGDIHVESEPGFGSTFTVWLPNRAATGERARTAPSEERARDAVLRHAAQESAAPASRRGNAVEASNEGAGRSDERPLVLVVEDHPEVRALIRGQLGPTYQVAEAADGKAGLEAARREEPDVIVADIVMPEMDGLALCRAVRGDATLADVPLLLLTARAAEEDELEGLSVGASDYLRKPFRPDVLRARVATLVERRRAMKERYQRELLVRPADVVVPSDDEAFIQRLLLEADKGLDNPGFGVEALAMAVGLSRRQLLRRVREVTGETPSALLRRLRLERAAQLLEQDAGTIAEVAYRSGFRNASHFSSAFSEHFGHAPSEHVANET